MWLNFVPRSDLLKEQLQPVRLQRADELLWKKLQNCTLLNTVLKILWRQFFLFSALFIFVVVMY